MDREKKHRRERQKRTGTVLRKEGWEDRRREMIMMMKGTVREKRQVWRESKRGDGERESERSGDKK